LGAQAAVERYAPPTAECVFVGKRGGRPSIKQPQIDELLVQHAQQGKVVVRLKGGCPSVFSRVSWATMLRCNQEEGSHYQALHTQASADLTLHGSMPHLRACGDDSLFLWPHGSDGRCMGQMESSGASATRRCIPRWRR
jgi:hypothetical protein